MTTEQALKVLDQATSLLNGNRAQHAQIIEALETLRKAVEKKD
jgi:hypothetical protein